MQQSANDKAKALSIALKQLEKQFGSKVVMSLGESAEKISPDNVIPTGSLALDLALGIGGFPKGRVIEIYGPESSGKTTIALHAIAECQKAGGQCVFIDAEHALDPSYAKKLGVDINSLLISQPDNGEQALEIADSMVRSGAVDLIVIDSVAALVPQKELEGEMGDSVMGLQARLMSQALRKITGTLHKTNTTVIFINQIRMKIGVMFGSPETTTGGNALKFYASIRLDIRKIGSVKSDGEVVAAETRIKVVKNKMAPPFAVVEVLIVNNKGISKLNDIVILGEKFGVLSKSGSWYSYNGDRVAQGKENMMKYLSENPNTANEIEAKIRENYNKAGNVDVILTSSNESDSSEE